MTLLLVLYIFCREYAQPDLIIEARDVLLNLHFPLTSLSIDIGAFSTEKVVSPIFSEFHKTLENLTIYRGPLGRGLKEFPFGLTFPRVRKLEITETTVCNLNFLQYFPILESLSICEPPEVEPSFVRTDMIQETADSLLNISKNIRFLRIDYQLTEADVKKLVKLFPSDGSPMKEIHMYLTNKSFRIVCEHWQDLEVLEIYGKEVNDEGLLGFYKEDAKKTLNMEREELEEYLDFSRRPRMYCLTNLNGML